MQRTRPSGHTLWPFEVRAVLGVWPLTSKVDDAMDFLTEWSRRRQKEPAWSEEQIEEEIQLLTDNTQAPLVEPPTKRG